MSKTNDELKELLVKSVAAYKAMLPSEKASLHRAQAISWIFGNLSLDGINLTKEQVEQAYDRLYGKCP